MKRKLFQIFVGAMLASVSSDVVAAGKMRLVKLPNVVNIYGDDVGYGDVGAKSPNLLGRTLDLVGRPTPGHRARLAEG
jgi:hypothetical protein